MGGHGKCLILMTRGGEGVGGKKPPKTCLRNTNGGSWQMLNFDDKGWGVGGG